MSAAAIDDVNRYFDHAVRVILPATDVATCAPPPCRGSATSARTRRGSSTRRVRRSRQVDLGTAAFVLALERVARATTLRGV